MLTRNTVMSHFLNCGVIISDNQSGKRGYKAEEEQERDMLLQHAECSSHSFAKGIGMVGGKYATMEESACR